jgi:hypothetical protein
MFGVKEMLSTLESMELSKTSGASRALALLNFKEHVHLVENHALVEAMISSLRKFESSSEREIVLGILERTACAFIDRIKQTNDFVSMFPNFFESVSSRFQVQKVMREPRH